MRHSLNVHRAVLDEAPERSWYRRYRFDLLWGVIVLGLVLAAFVVPHLHLGSIIPVINQTAVQTKVLAQTAPLLGQWLPHVSWASAGAAIIAVTIVRWGPSMAQTIRWRRLVGAAWIISAAWTMSLALIDGWSRGFVSKMGGQDQYLSMVPRVRSVSGLVHGFATHIPAGQPGSWDIDVAGHPVGALLTFVGLDRIGLSGPIWASSFCVLAGSSTAAAVLIAVRALSGEATARRVAPFVGLAPVAVWIGVSADAYYAGVAAWGLTLLAVAAAGTTRFSAAASLGAGVLLGFCIYLDYGLILMAIPALAVLMIAHNYRPLIGAALGAVAVATLFTTMGFWWLGGLSLLRHRYWTTIAMDRPLAYWSWANLASLTCAIGLSAATALRRAFNLPAIRARTGLNVLLVSFVVVVVAADVSALSKAETERIWLPFAVWLVAAPALLPRRSHRFCLGVQATGALLINSLLLTSW